MVFDPTAECVVAPQQKKKKKALSKGRNLNKLFNISCCLISTSTLERGVPRGTYRANLKKSGNEAIIGIKQSMTAEQVKGTISEAFSFSDGYSLLSCSQEGKFKPADDQAPDGNAVVNIDTF